MDKNEAKNFYQNKGKKTLHKGEVKPEGSSFPFFTVDNWDDIKIIPDKDDAYDALTYAVKKGLFIPGKFSIEGTMDPMTTSTDGTAWDDPKADTLKDFLDAVKMMKPDTEKRIGVSTPIRH